MFLMGVRASTWLALLTFLALALARRDRRPLAAAAVWLLGFEATFQLVSLTAGRGLPRFWWASLTFVAAGVTAAVVAERRGLSPDPRILLAAAVIWAAWILTGFHVNPHTGPVDPQAEVLNELAKTLWAAAYLWPLRANGSAVRALLRPPGLR